MESRVMYHVNPFSGVPNMCDATVKACPWSKTQKHYPTAKEAVRAFEVALEESIEKATEKEAMTSIMDDFAKDYASGDLALDPKTVLNFVKMHGLGSKVDAQLLSDLIVSGNKPGDSLAGEIKADPKLPKRTWLSKVEYETINTAGIRCSHCKTAYDAVEASKIVMYSGMLKCYNCGVESGRDEVLLAVTPAKDTHPALKAKNVAKLTWYHSTQDETWEETITEAFPAHVGSLQAAIDRHLTENSSSSGFWLYEVEVDKKLKVSKTIDTDENGTYNDWTSGSYDVQRYVNSWEDPASISLVVKSQKLKVKRRTWVLTSEATTSRSFYNMDPKLLGLH